MDARFLPFLIVAIVIGLTFSSAIPLTQHTAPGRDGSSRLSSATDPTLVGSWTTACGSSVDPNASPCAPGAPYLCPRNPFPNPTCWGREVASTTIPGDQGFIELSDYNVRHGAGPYYSYDTYYLLWVYYEGVWFNWTAGSGVQSILDGAPLSVPFEGSPVSIAFDANDTFYLTFVTEWSGCGYAPWLFPARCNPDYSANTSTNITVYATPVFPQYNIWPALLLVTTLPGSESYLYNYFSNSTWDHLSCQQQVSSEWDPALGYTLVSFFGNGGNGINYSYSGPPQYLRYGACGYGFWFEVWTNSTTGFTYVRNATGAVDPSRVFQYTAGGYLNVFGPLNLVYDPPDDALVAMNDSANVFMLNGTGTWTVTNLLFPSAAWIGQLYAENVILSGPTPNGTLFLATNATTGADLTYLFSYTIFGGFHLLPIMGPSPPGLLGYYGQGGVYGSQGIITRTLYAGNVWNNGTYLLTIGPPKPPAPTDLVAEYVNATDVFLTWTQSTGGDIVNSTAYVYLGYGCVPDTWYGITDIGVATSWDQTGLSVGTAFSFAVTSWNSSGQSPQSTCLDVSTPGVPPAPTDFVAAIVNATDVFYTWDQATGGGLQANAIYVFLGSSCGVTVFTYAYLSPAVTSGDIPGLTPSTTFSAYVSASNASGEGPDSNCVTVTTPALPPPAPTILQVANVSGAIAVLILIPYNSCWIDCNTYGIVNVTVYYAPLYEVYYLNASWVTTYHTPTGVDLSWQPTTTIYLHGLIPNESYTFIATVWNLTDESANSTAAHYTTPPCPSCQVYPPIMPRVGINATQPGHNVAAPQNPLNQTVVLDLGDYTPSSGTLYVSTVKWTNTYGGTFDYEFALEASWLQYASNINVTASGTTLTPSSQFGAGTTVIYVYPGSVSVKNNSTVTFTVTFNYNSPSPLTGGVLVNGVALTASLLYAIASGVIVGVVGFVAFAMKKTSSFSVLGILVFLLAIGVELFA